jgi:hypothetical protein
VAYIISDILTNKMKKKKPKCGRRRRSCQKSKKKNTTPPTNDPLSQSSEFTSFLGWLKVSRGTKTISK